LDNKYLKSTFQTAWAVLFCVNVAFCACKADQKLFLKINGCRHPVLTGAAVVLSDAIYIPQIIYWYSLGYGQFRDSPGALNFGAIGLAATFSTVALTQGIKAVVKRERPIFSVKAAQGDYAPGFWARVIPSEKYSCPSQNSALAASSAIIMGYALPGWDKYFYALTVLIGWARIYRGAHYPGDVLLGYGTGTLSTFGTLALLKKLDGNLDIREVGPKAPIFRVAWNIR
jgi:undecaprenyl-diphosphatase